MNIPQNRYFYITLMTLFALTMSSCSINANKRLNILIIGVCSLRKDRLSIYNDELETSPNLKKFAQNANIFTNAYNNTSWLNYSSFLDKLTLKKISKNGYQAIGDINNRRYVVAKKKNPANPPSPYYQRISGPKHYQLLKKLKETITRKRNRPFYLGLHFKWPHVPYSDPDNKYYDKFFSKRSRLIFEKYKNQYSNNIIANPAAKILFGELKNIHKGKSHEQRVSSAKLLYDDAILSKWTKSKTYIEDINLIKESYDGQIHEFDRSLATLLNLYNDKSLQKNTVVIFTGDHGEAHMDHGQLIHGKTVYDTALGFPLVIKFPGAEKSHIITQQFQQSSLFQIVEAIMEGKVNHENFSSFIANNINDDVLYSRNCANTTRSIRYKNEWKLIHHIHSDIRELYNLRQDPLEHKNLARTHKEKLAKLQELLLDYQEPAMEGHCQRLPDSD